MFQDRKNIKLLNIKLIEKKVLFAKLEGQKEITKIKLLNQLIFSLKKEIINYIIILYRYSN